MTTIDDVAYRTIDGITLLARLYRPNTDGPVKWMIDVHGGAWGSGDRLNNAVIHADLAAHGVGVCALDFRLSDEAQYPAMVDDVNLRHPLVQGAGRNAGCRNVDAGRARLVQRRTTDGAGGAVPGQSALDDDGPGTDNG